MGHSIKYMDKNGTRHCYFIPSKDMLEDFVHDGTVGLLSCITKQQ